jgi:hypothetical protein
MASFNTTEQRGIIQVLKDAMLLRGFEGCYAA